MASIGIEDAEKALFYLKETDTEFARRKAEYESLVDLKKTIIALEFQDAKGSAAERTKIAEAADTYQLHVKKIKDALYGFEEMRNKRKSAELQIEMWRSINSNIRRGNI